jgi:hypothetical protein
MSTGIRIRRTGLTVGRSGWLALLGCTKGGGGKSEESQGTEGKGELHAEVGEAGELWRDKPSNPAPFILLRRASKDLRFHGELM